MDRIEFPAGSGVFAEYDPFERHVMREALREYEDGRVSRSDVLRDLRFLHEMKSILGARIVDADIGVPVEQLPLLPGEASEFQIPPKARERLERGQRARELAGR